MSKVRRDSDAVAVLAELSDREFLVFHLLAAGLTVKQAAERLHLSSQTVSTYRARVLRKLNLRTTAEIMRYAIKHDLGD